MFEYSLIIYYILNNIFYTLLFCYLFLPLYKKCNIQKKIVKHGKTKIVSQPNIILCYLYFMLLYFIFKLSTIKIFLFILAIISLFSIFMLHNFSKDLNLILNKYNKNSFLVLSWKIFHSLFTMIYLAFRPINNYLDSYINKKFLKIKNAFESIINIESSSLNEKNEKTEETEQNKKKITETGDKNKKNLQNDKVFDFKINEKEQISNMSDYLIKTNKSSKSKKNINENKNILDEEISDENLNYEEKNNNLKKELETLFNNIVLDGKDLENSNSNQQTKSSKEDIFNDFNKINKMFDENSMSNIEDITMTEHN